MANTWLNSDGLFIKFGTQEGTIGGATGIGWASEYEDGGQNTGGRMTEVVLKTMTAITASSASGAGIVSDTVTIPNGARIEAVEVVTFTAATGAGAVLNVGLINQDRTTEVDFDGLLAAIPVANFDTAGETRRYAGGIELYEPAGTNYGGALIGTTLSSTGLITCDYDTGAFTAGIIKVRIFWSKPASTTSP